jgi:DNA-binding MarR family transcriptional regulator
LPDPNKWFSAGSLVRSDQRGAEERLAVAENEQLIADIMVVQQQLRSLFAADRSDPLFSSHLTLSQLKILMLLSRHGTLSGGELARMLGVGLATSSGMIDRLVVQDLVTRSEDLHDRRVRRIGLTRAGSRLIASIVDAGQEKMRALLSRLSAEELEIVSRATALLVRAAEQESGAGPAEPGPAEPSPAEPSTGELGPAARRPVGSGEA